MRLHDLAHRSSPLVSLLVLHLFPATLSTRQERFCRRASTQARSCHNSDRQKTASQPRQRRPRPTAQLDRPKTSVTAQQLPARRSPDREPRSKTYEPVVPESLVCQLRPAPRLVNKNLQQATEERIRLVAY